MNKLLKTLIKKPTEVQLVSGLLYLGWIEKVESEVISYRTEECRIWIAMNHIMTIRERL